ncbi:MAG: STAS domain-containing protein [Planctomycetota bacterium]|jgi:anti-anti-sigma factor|nr:STAS domain-containing protein [Planctomycetota bacterium]MDP7132292.1 STAS domain-containing protein [Planctomycetota bacterium]|tara:strand:- start:282 stop:626 length:345 start_codon:yes stop_codon:yes gene_type:complete
MDENKFKVESQGASILITLGYLKLTHEELNEWGHWLEETASNSSGLVVVLDMRSVQTISSVAIGKLFKARKILLDSGGELRLVSASKPVLDVFRICRIDRLVKVCTSLDAAMAS